MDTKFTLVINAGRSGSTFLYEVLKKNYTNEAKFFHEFIPSHISKPRLYNRAYSEEKIKKVIEDQQLRKYFTKWEKMLEKSNLIETGWTAYHLAPVLHHLFKDKFQVVILHRHPVDYAASRYTMGNYHKYTLYDDSHEVSPFDHRSIAPEFKEQWATMNGFEKCLYWWYVVLKEGYEFKLNSGIPNMVLTSHELFGDSEKIQQLVQFAGLAKRDEIDTNVTKNPIVDFKLEAFPLGDRWRQYYKSNDILEFAKELGYKFDDKQILKKMKKYQLPDGLLPFIRHKSNYWIIRKKIAGKIKDVKNELIGGVSE